MTSAAFPLLLLLALAEPVGTATGPIPRQREGTAIRNLPGQFQLSGDRLTFQAADSPRRYVVLENLCLERVERLLSDKGSSVAWSVDGTVTQFRGSNYLLLNRATVRLDSTLKGPAATDAAPTKAGTQPAPSPSPLGSTPR